MVHANICTSEKIDKLSAEAERLYIRLLTHVDDLGNISADPELIRKACFPRKKRWNNWSIQVWLDKIVEVGLAMYYEDDGVKYLHYDRFEDFQTLNYKNARYPRHPDDGGGHQPMSGVVIDDDRGGHEGMTGEVIGDECGGQVPEPALVSTDTNPKFLSKKEVRGSKPSPPVSNQTDHRVSSGSPSSAQQVPPHASPPPAPVGSKKLRDWDEDIDGTPAAAIRRAIIYHLDHNLRDFHRKPMSISYVRNRYLEMMEDVPEGWEPPKPKIHIQYDPHCPKCRGMGGFMPRGRGIGRVWQPCDCGEEVSHAAA
jgi:hypothetical protein